MYCRKCRYPLYGLPENRCPECGTPFDPADPRSFRTRLPSARRRAVAAYLAVVAALAWYLVGCPPPVIMF